MTPDVTRLREKLDELESLVSELELELVDDPHWAEPSDTSYLSAKDRENPDIMSNVEAMAATNKLIAWFGRDMEGFVGLWRGPDSAPLEKAPVLRLDSEGQYDMVAATIGDYLLISASGDDFAANRTTLVEAGFDVASSPDAIWDALDGFACPNDYRHVLYNEARVRRGLKPIEG